MKVRKTIMRDLEKYEVEDFYRYAEWYIGKVTPTAMKAIVGFAKEHPEEKELRSDIFATMVRASVDIQNEFLGMALSKSGITRGHDCFCRFVRPIRTNMFHIQIQSGEFVARDKLTMDEINLPEAYRIKRLIHGYGIALERLEDILVKDGYDAVLQHLCALDMQTKPVTGELEMRKMYLRDHPLGIHITTLVSAENWKNKVPVRVSFDMIPEKLGTLVKLIPRDEQKTIIERRDEMIDEFGEAFIRYQG